MTFSERARKLNVGSRLLPTVAASRLVVIRQLTATYALFLLVGLAPSLWRLSLLPPHSYLPVGLLSVFGPAPPPRWALVTLWSGALVSGICFAFGRALRHSGVAFAACVLMVLTFRNCWGQIFHTDNLVVLHLALLALVPGEGAHGADSPTHTPSAEAVELGQNWNAAIVRSMQLATVGSYFLAGWAKLDHTGWSWALGDTLRAQLAYDTLRKQTLDSFVSPLALPLLRQSWLFLPASVATLAVELLAPLALLGGRVAILWAIAAWLFHFGILASMAIVFPYPLTAIAYVCILPTPRGLPWRWFPRFP